MCSGSLINNDLDKKKNAVLYLNLSMELRCPCPLLHHLELSDNRPSPRKNRSAYIYTRRLRHYGSVLSNTRPENVYQFTIQETK